MPSLRCLLLLIVVAIALPLTAFAQGFEGTRCQLPGNAALRDNLAKGSVPRLETYYGAYVMWGTSFLAPSGKAPAEPKPGDDDAAMAYTETLVKWTCQYDPGKAQDGDTATAWVEGVKGNGEGEILIVQVNTRKPVEVWSGYGKSAALHAANARPRKVRLRVLQTLNEPMGHQVGYVFTDVVVLATAEVELKDVNNWQPLALPAHTLRPAKQQDGTSLAMDDDRGMWPLMTFVAIEILSVYPGAKWQDTAISEVRNAAK